MPNPATYKTQPSTITFTLDRSGRQELKKACQALKTEVEDCVSVIRRWKQDSKLLNKITAILSDAFVRLTLDGTIVEFNASACKLFGVDEATVLGRHINTLLFSDWVFLKDKTGSYVEHDAKTCAGDRLVVSTSVTSNGNEYVLLMRNITKQIQQEHDLRLLSSALDATSDVIVITNKMNEIVFVNEAFTKHTGYTKQEVLGKDPGFYKSPLNLKETYYNMWRNLAGKKAWEGTLFNESKDGQLLEDYTVITPLMNGDPNVPAYYIAVKRNISRG